MWTQCYLLLPLLWIVGLAQVNAEENVALKKPVRGGADAHAWLVDGNLNTAIKPKDSTNPMIWIDLQNLYRIESFELYAQNDAKLGEKGINVPFTLYAWANYTSECDIEGLYPWTPVKKGLKFTKKGEMIKVDGPVEAQYLIIRPDFEDLYENHQGLPMGELKAFGQKIRDGYRFELPEDGIPLPNVWNDTRQLLLKNQTFIFAQVSYFKYIPDLKYQDVSLAWHYNRTNTMAAIRGKARMILMSGPRVIQKLQNSPDYEALRNNAREYLSPENPNAKYVNVSQGFSDGDILLITRFDQFDVDKVVNALKSGKNSAVISYLSSRKPRDNKVAQLLQKMEIIIEYVLLSDGNLNQNATEFINTRKDIPWDYELNVALSSWKQFNSQEYLLYIPNALLYTDEYQNKIRQVLDKYHDMFTYLAPCLHHDYKWKNETATGLINYNKVLLLQRGKYTRPAPGALRSPGYVKHTAKPKTVIVEFKEDQAGEFIPTGCYAAPGQPVRYTVLNHSFPGVTYYWVRINPQTDSLVKRNDSYGRWPLLSYRERLEYEGVITSPFGGPIVLTLPTNETLKIKFEGVYRYPWFDIRDPNARKNWDNERKNHRGCPHGMIAGDMMHSMMEEAAILKQNAETIHWNVNFFDNMVKFMHNYRGSDYTTYKHEVFVTDDDIVIGFAHSGYPWMSYRSVGHTFADMPRNKRGENFLFPHEIGHNLQVRTLTFRNGGEVTNNMYIPAVRKYLLGIDGYRRPGIRPGNTPNELRMMVESWKGVNFTGVKESFYNYFSINFGPGLIANVFDRAKKPTCNWNIPEPARIDFWIRHMCKESGYDLVPFHSLWHFPFEDAAIKYCRQFPCWFPDDEYTRQVPDIVNKILQDYGRECQRTKPRQIEFRNDPKRGFDQVRPQKIFITEE